MLTRGNIVAFVEKPTTRCEDCPLDYPKIPVGDEAENPSCVANSQRREEAGLPRIPCGLILARYGVDTEQNPRAKRRVKFIKTIVYIDIAPPGGLEELIKRESGDSVSKVRVSLEHDNSNNELAPPPESIIPSLSS